MSLRRYFRRGRADQELKRELATFVEEEAAEVEALGVAAAEARRRARLKLGNEERIREELWRQNSMTWLDSLARDARFAARSLRRSPAFAIVAILVMTLGIGANVALYAVVRGVLLRPLPYAQPQQLVAIYETVSLPGYVFDGGNRFMPVAGGSFGAWRDALAGPRPMAELSLVSPGQQYNLSSRAGGAGAAGQLPEKIDAAWCSSDFFATLGVTPALGRGFAPDDDKPGAPATAMLTDGLWRRRFDADPAAVGKMVWLDAAPYTIVGVLPASFVYESGKGGSAAQVWTPAGREYGAGLTSIFDDHQFVAVGRLAPSVTLPELVSRLNAVQRGVKASHPAPAVHDAVIGRSLLDDAVSDYRTPLYSLLAAAGCVLLIACMNLAGLMLARHAARSQEIAVRAALGASRTRLLRERVMECLWLAAAGAALGLALARLSLGWLVRARPDLNRIDAVRLDAGTVWFTLAVMAACALLTGVASSLRTGDASLAGVLRGGRQPNGGGRGHDGLRRGLVAAEVGCTVVLLIGAGLLLKSYQRLRSVDLGVPIDHALTMQISLPDAHYSEPGQRVGFFERLLAQLRAMPGVSGAGLVTTAPGQGWGGDVLVSVVEHPAAPKGDSLDLQTRAADPGYFAAVGLPLLRGRLFTSAERLDKSRVVVISASAVKLCFPGEDPIGRHVKGESSGISYEVVGVVGDARWRVDLTPKPTMYLPLYNNTTSAATIVVNSGGRAEAMAVAAQQLISGMDPDLPVSDVRTLRETVGRAALGAQINSLLVLAFALIALLLAAAGLYGVLAYLVTQRTAEIGVRIAPGARRGQLLRTVLWDGLRPAVIGLACGLVASVAAVRLIASMLFNTPPLDTAVFAAVAAALLIVATIACLMPAWRASRLSPLTALRAG